MSENDQRDAVYPNWQNKSGCLCCGAKLCELRFESSERYFGGETKQNSSVNLCRACGWWAMDNGFFNNPVNNGTCWPRTIWSRSWAVWRSFALNQSDAPITEVRAYLDTRYSDVSFVNSDVAEELVRSVFKDFYKGAEVSYFRGRSQSPDGGIDLVIIETTGNTIAVQIKRRLRPKTEPVAEVRSFVTAMIVNGFHQGAYVAVSSSFGKAAKSLTSNPYLAAHGVTLSLIDAKRFADLLHTQANASAHPIWYEELRTKQNCSDAALLEECLERYRSLVPSNKSSCQSDPS